VFPFLVKEFMVVLFFAAAHICLSGKEIHWEKVKVEKGVSVYRAKVNELIAFRGIGEMKGNAEDLVSIIENPAGWKNWIKNLKTGKLIEQISPSHKIFYQSIHSPFPFSDRDVVYESRILRDLSKTTRVEMKSVTHPNAPSSIGVRINILFTRYKIDKIDDNTVLVTFETLSDPGGALPRFVVNWASASYPITLLDGLRSQLKTIQKIQTKE